MKKLAPKDKKRDTIQKLSTSGCLFHDVYNPVKNILQLKQNLKKFLYEELQANKL